MLDFIDSDEHLPPTGVAPEANSTPRKAAGPPLQTRRRIIFVTLATTTVFLLITWLAYILYKGGLVAIEPVILLLLLIYLPWPVVGFWNSILGFSWLNVTRDAAARVIPQAGRASPDQPIRLRTAIAMTLYNEAPERALLHLRTVMESVENTGEGGNFSFFILSDSTDPAISATEEALVAQWRAERDDMRLTYRRRTTNAGFKGGNVHDFCARWGPSYDLLVLLDIDSLMTGPFVVKLVRIMQENPQLGILQSLAVGLPSSSLFARLFQFGHRLGMCCFVVGAGWWQGDRCQFWGHNAAIRIAPFTQHCSLPILPGPPPFGGPIICHDQIEAAYMRRAGFDVRLLPFEGGSYEGNPPSLIDFLGRNRRWCQGNLQNLRLIGSPGLSWVSRFHLAFMAQKFVGRAALALLIMFAAIAAMTRLTKPDTDQTSLLSFCAVFLLIQLTPKISSIADVLINRPARFGGKRRVIVGAMLDFCFTCFLAPIATFESAGSVVSLMVGRAGGWSAQRRDVYSTDPLDLARSLWAPTAAGLLLGGSLAVAAPHSLIWFSPLVAALSLAVPFAFLTGSPRLGRWAARHGVCGTAEEFDPPSEIQKVLPVVLTA